MTRAILSDLDGVLVDSHASVMRAWRWWADGHGIEADPDEWVEHGRPSGSVIGELRPDLDEHAEAAAIDERQANDVDGVVALPGAAELLGPAGPRPLAVVTSGVVALATARLRAAGLDLPDVLITPERVHRGKPDPEPYLLGARDLGVDPANCVVLEDAPAGIAAGRAAGMHVVGITTTLAAAQLADAHEHAASVAEWLSRASPLRSTR
ncbi:MAG: HAD-IA family hydrolase [Solirubrobacteraceae bacterium]